MLGVVVLYLSVNFVCLRVLGPTGLAETHTPATAVMRAALGDRGAFWIAVGIAVSTLGFLSQGILTAPRVYYAMARDGLFFKSVGWLSPKTGAPVVAIVVQGIAATIIALSGRYEQILNYVVSIDFISFALTAASLFVFRRRDKISKARHRRGCRIDRLSRARSSLHHCSFRFGVRSHRHQHNPHVSHEQRLRLHHSRRGNSRIFVLEPQAARRSHNIAMTQPERALPQLMTRLHRHSDYMQWAKLHSKSRFNLATSGVGAYPLRELPVTIDQLEINGDNSYGFAPLQQAIATKHEVDPACVVEAAGTSMANYLAMAALIDPGDEVLIESPTYELIVSAARYLQAKIVRFPRREENGFAIDPEEIRKAITPKTKARLSNQPSQPKQRPDARRYSSPSRRDRDSRRRTSCGR